MCLLTRVPTRSSSPSSSFDLTITSPDSALDVALPLAGGPYTCTDTRLDVTGTAGDTTIPLILER